MRYAVVIEKAGRNYSAYVPDLPGCIATGATPAAVERRIRAAISMHLSGMRKDGLAAPRPSARTRYVLATIGKPAKGVAPAALRRKSA